jgi:predicted TIM-barrel fold metal-dependent hydrolase
VAQRTTGGRTEVATLVSADSHVIEPTELWADVLPRDYWGDAPATFSQRPGGFDPKARLDEMTTDGVSAEVLYPSLALKLFALEDPAQQEESFRRYNNWLAEYCSVSPARLVGIGAVSTYDIDHAVAEAKRCHAEGLRGIEVWQSPHPDLPFDGRHYDPLWQACAGLGLPVSLHILTGYDYSQEIYRQGSSLTGTGLPMYRLSINLKLLAIMDSLMEIVLSGTLDRFRELEFVLVENEAAWLPFFIDQWDYYFERFRDKNPVNLTRPPSVSFTDQVHVTFFRDPNIGLVVERFGPDNFMWSNDYPHGNSTWPHSREVVNDRLGGLDRPTFDKLAFENACGLYGIDLSVLNGQAQP